MGLFRIEETHDLNTLLVRMRCHGTVALSVGEADEPMASDVVLFHVSLPRHHEILSPWIIFATQTLS